MTCLVEGRQSHFAVLMYTTEVPNWFSSHTLGLIGTLIPPKHSKWVTGSITG